MDVQQTSNVSQVLQWLNGLTLPTLLGAAFAAARWLTKKEDAVKSMFAGLQGEIESLKSNHLHHIQQTLDELKTGQERHYATEDAHQRELIQSINGSKDAIVQAILTLKN